MVSFAQGFSQLLSKKPKFQRQLNASNITPKQRNTFNLLIGLPKETKTAVKKQPSKKAKSKGRGTSTGQRASTKKKSKGKDRRGDILSSNLGKKTLLGG